MAILKSSPETVSRDHVLLTLTETGRIPLPGQFVNIRVNKGTDPLLRRPFSIFDFTNNRMEIVVRIIGKGTSLLASALPGEMDILGPLGKGFTIEKNKHVLLVGGGVGNAPLMYLARVLKENGCDVTFLYGARSKEYIYLADRFRSASNRFMVVTDDGTEGEKGFVTDVADKLLKSEKFDRIYTCGPTAMMRVLWEKVNGKVPLEISVENYFGCGVGLCVGCTVQTSCGFQRACMEGPVFDASVIEWESMHD